MSEPTYAQLALSLDELNANLREVLALLLEDGEAAIELRTT
jgi:predicted RNase H-like HicB family nuclease